MRGLLILAAFLLAGAAPVEACKYRRGPFLDALDRVAAGCTHALCGRIYPADPARLRKDASSCGADPWIALSSDLWKTLAGGGAVVLGEAHDSALHHRLRAALLSADETVLGTEPDVAFVLEQIRADQQDGLDLFADTNAHARSLGTLSDFKRFLKWEASGWEKYDYDPLLTTLIESGRPLVAGDPARDTIKTIAREGASALPAAEHARLALDEPLGSASDEASLKEIGEAHCGAIPNEMLAPMAFAQRYRDAHLADATLRAAAKHGSAVLITGNNHARTDRGAPWYIRKRAPDMKVVSVMLIEVEEGETSPQAYLPRSPGGDPATDYVIFTPRAERGDPCAQLLDKATGKSLP